MCSSTGAQLLQMSHLFQKSLAEKAETDAIFLNCMKAFDRIPHAVLLRKLADHGVGGNIFSPPVASNFQSLDISCRPKSSHREALRNVWVWPFPKSFPGASMCRISHQKHLDGYPLSTHFSLGNAEWWRKSCSKVWRCPFCNIVARFGTTERYHRNTDLSKPKKSSWNPFGLVTQGGGIMIQTSADILAISTKPCGHLCGGGDVVKKCCALSKFGTKKFQAVTTSSLLTGRAPMSFKSVLVSNCKGHRSPSEFCRQSTLQVNWPTPYPTHSRSTRLISSTTKFSRQRRMISRTSEPLRSTLTNRID